MGDAFTNSLGQHTAIPLKRRRLLTRSEDLLVDARGNAYLTDKSHGPHVARYTGG